MSQGVLLNKTANQGKVVTACQKWLRVSDPNGPQSGNDCFDFIRSVAKELGVALHGNANDMFSQIQRPPWHSLGTGMRGAQLGAREARKGSLNKQGEM